MIADLADNGGNLTRIRIDPNQYPIERREISNFISGTNYFGINDIGKPISYFLNNYDNNQTHMWELDKTFDLLDSKKIYTLLCVLEDQFFSVASAYDWAKRDVWNTNPYSTITGNSYPGNKAFFSNPSSKAVFKKYLAYIHARWGYGPSLAAYEMVNETHNVANDINHNIDSATVLSTIVYFTDPALRSDVSNWVCEMKTELKLKEPVHLVTTGPSEYRNPGMAFDTIPCLDFWIQNEYSFYSSDDDYYNRDFQRHSLATKWFNTKRPFIWGELGMPDYTNDIDTRNDRTFHNANWISIMSGALGCGMYWNDMGQVGGINHRANFNAIKAFVADVDWNQKWIPYSNVAYMDGLTVNGKTMYTFHALRADGKAFIAYTHNNSSHWANEPASVYDVPSSIVKDTLAKRQGITLPQLKYNIDGETDPLNNPYFLIRNLPTSALFGLGKPYSVDIYKTYGSGGIIKHINTNSVGPFLAINIDMPYDIGPINYPDYAFIGEELSVFRTADTIVMNSKDSIYLKPDFLAQNVNYTYLYDWGNGTTSNDSSAIVHYTNAGTYIISLTVKNTSNDTSATYYQTITVKDLAKLQTEANVVIYPNPTMGSFHLKYDELLFLNPTIKIYDAFGKLITMQKVTNPKIHLPQISNGIYFLQFYGLYYQKTLKLVVQN